MSVAEINTIQSYYRHLGTSFQAAEMAKNLVEALHDNDEIILDFEETESVTSSYTTNVIRELILQNSQDIEQWQDKKKITLKSNELVYNGFLNGIRSFMAFAGGHEDKENLQDKALIVRRMLNY